MNRVVQFALAGIALSLAGCATNPVEIRPTGVLPTQGTPEQAHAECGVEARKAVAGMQNFGAITYTGRTIWEECMHARGYGYYSG